MKKRDEYKSRALIFAKLIQNKFRHHFREKNDWLVSDVI